MIRLTSLFIFLIPIFFTEKGILASTEKSLDFLIQDCLTTGFLEYVWISDSKICNVMPKPCIKGNYLVGVSWNEGSKLVCINLNDGKLIWKTYIGKESKGMCEIKIWDDIICININGEIKFFNLTNGKKIEKVVANKILSFAWLQGDLVILDDNKNVSRMSWPDLKLVWQCTLIDSDCTKLGFAGKNILVSGRWEIIAINPFNGKQLWKGDVPAPQSCNPVGDNKRIIVGCENGVLYSLNAINGLVMWEHDTRWHNLIKDGYPGGEKAFEILTAPYIDRSRLFLFTGSHPLHKAVTVLDTNTGNIISKSGRAESVDDWVIIGEHIVFISPKGAFEVIHIVDIKSMTEIGNVTIHSRNGIESILSTEGDLLIISESGNLTKFHFLPEKIVTDKMSLFRLKFKRIMSANLPALIFILISIILAAISLARAHRVSRAKLFNCEVQMKISLTYLVIIFHLLLTLYASHFYVRDLLKGYEMESLFFSLTYLFPFISFLYFILIYPSIKIKGLSNLDPAKAVGEENRKLTRSLVEAIDNACHNSRALNLKENPMILAGRYVNESPMAVTTIFGKNHLIFPENISEMLITDIVNRH